jgi:hypothetical protein
MSFANGAKATPTYFRARSATSCANEAMSVAIRIAINEVAKKVGALGLCDWIDTYPIERVRCALSSMAIKDFHE